MKQSRNQHTGASGITQREASQLFSMMDKLDKLQNKPNLYRGYTPKIIEIKTLIYEILAHAGRL